MTICPGESYSILYDINLRNDSNYYLGQKMPFLTILLRLFHLLFLLILYNTGMKICSFEEICPISRTDGERKKILQLDMQSDREAAENIYGGVNFSIFNVVYLGFTNSG